MSYEEDEDAVLSLGSRTRKRKGSGRCKPGKSGQKSSWSMVVLSLVGR
jgi:hypothetical protein